MAQMCYRHTTRFVRFQGLIQVLPVKKTLNEHLLNLIHAVYVYVAPHCVDSA